MFSQSTASLGALPVELKREICEYLCSHCAFTSGGDGCIQGPQSLANLCATSRTFRDIAQPILYHVFIHNRSSVVGSLTAFMRTICRNPELAAHVRCILNRSEEELFTYDMTLNQDYSYSAHEAGFDLETSALKAVLLHANNIETLDLPFEGCLPPFGLASLRSLRIHFHVLEPTMEAPLTPLLFPEMIFPNLRRLELVGWDFDCNRLELLLRKEAQVEQLLISSFRRLSDFSDEFAALFAQGFPRLSVFRFWEPHSPAQGQLLDLLTMLRRQKDTIEVIDVVSWGFIVDFRMLKEFKSLRTLSIDSESILLPLRHGIPELPRSLETLQFSDLGMDETLFTDFVIGLSKSAGKLTNLKRVKFIRYKRAADLDHLERQNLAFEAAGVAKNFGKAGVAFEIEDDYVVASEEELRGRQQNEFSTLGWHHTPNVGVVS